MIRLVTISVQGTLARCCGRDCFFFDQFEDFPARCAAQDTSEKDLEFDEQDHAYRRTEDCLQQAREAWNL